MWGRQLFPALVMAFQPQRWHLLVWAWIAEHPVSLSHQLLPATRLSPNPKPCPCRYGHREPPCWWFFFFFLLLLGVPIPQWEDWVSLLAPKTFQFLGDGACRGARQESSGCSPPSRRWPGVRPGPIHSNASSNRSHFLIYLLFSIFDPVRSLPSHLYLAPSPSSSCPCFAVSAAAEMLLWVLAGGLSSDFIGQNAPCLFLVFLFHPRVDLHVGGSGETFGDFLFSVVKLSFYPAAC